jgi:phospholipid/cholesterol/gamma-HCH transport system substrate-binding protein
MVDDLSGYRRQLVTAVMAVLAAASVLVLGLYVSNGLPSVGTEYTVRAVVPTSGSLASGARVTMAGAEVGVVTSIQQDGTGAIVTMQLTNSRVTPIPSNSTIALKERTPVGENYIAVTPGDAHTFLPSGGILSIARAATYVDVDQILSVLQGKTTPQARRLIAGLGTPLAGRGPQLSQLLGATANTITSGSSLVDLLSSDRQQLSELVQNLGDLTAAVGKRGDAIDEIGSQALATFRDLASQGQSIRSVLRQLPATLTEVRAAGDKIGTASGVAAPVLANLAAAVRQIRPAVIELRPAAPALLGTLDQLGAASPVLQTTLRRVHAISAPLVSTLPRIHTTLCQVDPMLKYLQPYTPDLISLVVGLGLGAESYDRIGHLLTLMPIVGEDSLVGLPANVSAATHTLIDAGLLQKVTGIQYDPYPAPGQIGKRTATKSVLGPQQFGQSGYVYPHIRAQC